MPLLLIDLPSNWARDHLQIVQLPVAKMARRKRVAVDFGCHRAGAAGHGFAGTPHEMPGCDTDIIRGSRMHYIASNIALYATCLGRCRWVGSDKHSMIGL